MRAWRIVNGVWTILFTLAALVQLNDPDPVQWTLVYGLAAVACGDAARGTRYGWLAPGVGVIAALWAALLASHALPILVHTRLFTTVEMMSPEVEEGREFLGLLIVAGWMLLLVFAARGRRTA